MRIAALSTVSTFCQTMRRFWAIGVLLRGPQCLRNGQVDQPLAGAFLEISPMARSGGEARFLAHARPARMYEAMLATLSRLVATSLAAATSARRRRPVWPTSTIRLVQAIRLAAQRWPMALQAFLADTRPFGGDVAGTRVPTPPGEDGSCQDVVDVTALLNAVAGVRGWSEPSNAPRLYSRRR
jgi:hypothetical protein